jgi:hypothetical protein
VPLLWLRVPAVFFHFLKDFKNYCASCWILFVVVVIADARNHEPEICSASLFNLLPFFNHVHKNVLKNYRDETNYINVTCN